MEKTSSSQCASKEPLVLTLIDYDAIKQQFINIIMFKRLKFLTEVVWLEYYCADVSIVDATEKPQLVLCS